MNIAFFDTKPYDRPAFLQYGKEAGISFQFFETKLNCDTAPLAKGHDGVCAFVNDCIDAKTIDSLFQGGVRVIALRCAGYNQVDLAHAFGKIHVLRVPAYSPHAVAEHAMAMLLASARRIPKAYNRTREFNFSLNGLTGFELHGKTVGIIGTGKIGRAFLEICRGFGMRAIAYDPFPLKESDIAYVSLERLFRESNILSLHCPLTEKTHHIINRKTLPFLQKGVFLINTSRGALIDAEALLEGIKSRIIGAACLDVYEEESNLFFEDYSGQIMDDDILARLLSMPNVLITSHQAFLTNEALNQIAKTTVSNLVHFFRHGVCENELCYQCGKMESCKRQRLEKCF